MPDLKSLLKKQCHNHLRTQSRRPVWKWKTTTKLVQKAEIATSEEHRKPKLTKKFMPRQVKRKIMKMKLKNQTISDAYPMPDLKSLPKKQRHNHLRRQSRRPVWKWKKTTKVFQKAEMATPEERRKPERTKKFMQRQVKRKIMKIHFLRNLKSLDIIYDLGIT